MRQCQRKVLDSIFRAISVANLKQNGIICHLNMIHKKKQFRILSHFRGIRFEMSQSLWQVLYFIIFQIILLFILLFFLFPFAFLSNAGFSDLLLSNHIEQNFHLDSARKRTCQEHAQLIFNFLLAFFSTSSSYWCFCHFHNFW